MKTHRVVYELDESGAWIATGPAVKGCHTYGRSINEAREHAREALGLFMGGAPAARLVDDVRPPASLRRPLEAQREARKRTQREQVRARAALSRAVRSLVEARGSAHAAQANGSGSRINGCRRFAKKPEPAAVGVPYWSSMTQTSPSPSVRVK